MEASKLTEYERLRLENVKRNEEKLSALKVTAHASQLSSFIKHQRPQYKSDNKSKVKKQKTAEPVIYRRSLRLKGASSDVSASDGHEIPDKLRPKMDLDSLELAVRRLHREKLSRQVESFSMSDAYRGNGSDRELIDLVRSFSREYSVIDKAELADCDTKRRVSGAVKFNGWDLKPKNVAQVVPGWIMDVKFFPTTEKTLVVAGNKSGNVGFWNVDAEEENGDHIYLYNLHTAPVSGIVIEPFSMSKIFTSSHDGFIRLMDIEREVFDSIYTSKYPVNSISGKPRDKDTIYFSEGHGVFDIWDLRAGSSSSTWKLHRSLIHTIDFNQENSNLMATSCSNGTACIWDLRKISTDKPVPLTTINHKNGVQSAYFSPSGRFLATTSIDLTVGISSGANYEDTCRIPHLNIGKGVSAFRGIWGWDDSYVYIGNMRGGIDVISASEKKIAGTFHSENMAAVPYRFDAHRYRVGMLVGATSVGEVYVCTSS